MVVLFLASLIYVFSTANLGAEIKKTPKTKPTVKYTAQVYNGKIGVFIKGRKKPQQTLSILVSSLPPKDRADLEKGIPLKNDKELIRFLEDFDS